MKDVIANLVPRFLACLIAVLCTVLSAYAAQASGRLLHVIPLALFAAFAFWGAITVSVTTD